MVINVYQIAELIKVNNMYGLKMINMIGNAEILLLAIIQYSHQNLWFMAMDIVKDVITIIII